MVLRHDAPLLSHPTVKRNRYFRPATFAVRRGLCEVKRKLYWRLETLPGWGQLTPDTRFTCSLQLSHATVVGQHRDMSHPLLWNGELLT